MCHDSIPRRYTSFCLWSAFATYARFHSPRSRRSFGTDLLQPLCMYHTMCCGEKGSVMGLHLRSEEGAKTGSGPLEESPST